MSMAEKAKKEGVGQARPTTVGHTQMAEGPSRKMETHDGVQVISGPCRTDTGIIGPQKLNFHLD